MRPVTSIASSALRGMQDCLRRMDRAAAVIAGAGGDSGSPGTGTGAPGADGAGAPEGGDLEGAMVAVLVAQRAYAAQVRVLETAAQVAGDTARLGDSAHDSR